MFGCYFGLCIYFEVDCCACFVVINLGFILVLGIACLVFCLCFDDLVDCGFVFYLLFDDCWGFVDLICLCC